MATRTINLETEGTNVYGIFKYGQGCVDHNTYYKFVEEYQKCDPDDEITININTLDGYLSYVLMICNIVKNHKGRTIGKITKCALNGGTLIALMCDEMHIDKNGCLGPFDPAMSSLMYTPVKDMINTFDKYQNNSWVCDMGSQMSKNIVVSFERKVRDMLLKKYTDTETNNIMKVFYTDSLTNCPIFVDELPSFLKFKITNGKKGKLETQDVEKEEPSMSFFMQMMQKRNSEPAKSFHN